MQGSSLYRVEIIAPNAAPECYPCLGRDALAELLTHQLVEQTSPRSFLVRIYDYDKWRPGSEDGLLRSVTILS